MLIDLTHTITPEMPMYPGSPAPALVPAAALDRDGYRETLLTLASHTGTHMDAPAHMLEEGASLEALPVFRFCGRAVVLDVSGLPPGSVLTAEFLREREAQFRLTEFLLFYTGWEKRWGTPAYCRGGFPVPDREAAQYLVSLGLKGVGTDALSVDTLEDETYPVHRTLLGGGLVILESLCLEAAAGHGDMTLYALPLKFENADGAPIRAVAEFRDLPEGKETDAL